MFDVSIQPLNAAHVLSYDFIGGRGAAHFPHMRAAFTLHPDLPLSPTSRSLVFLDVNTDFWMWGCFFFSMPSS